MWSPRALATRKDEIPIRLPHDVGPGACCTATVEGTQVLTPVQVLHGKGVLSAGICCLEMKRKTVRF